MIGSTSSRPPFPVTLDNWQAAPQLGWTFQHMAEIFPTASISRGAGPVSTLHSRPEPLDQIICRAADGTPSTVAQVMAATETDGWMVLQSDSVLTEQYVGDFEPARPHLLMSVSKSIVGSVVASLVGSGQIDVGDAVTRYIPQLATSGYLGANVRDLLDMRSGIHFSEDYLDPRAEVRVLEQAFGWAPRQSADVPDSMRNFLLSLRQASPHGGPFNYRSCETDVLGWVCESATGRRFPQLAAELVWSQIGAEFDANIGIDREGTGMFDGGISATLGDLARFGAMILRNGTSLTGAQVVPASWIEDSFTGGRDSRQAFEASMGDNRMPGGMYRNQFWVPFADRPVLLCLGIHGQMIYVNRTAGVVAVKLSSWPTPQDAWKLFSTVAAFDAISAELTPPAVGAG